MVHLERFLAQVRTVFARETLPPPPPGSPRPPRRRIAALLLAVEPLPRDPEAPRRERPGARASLLAAERLPQDPEQPAVATRTPWLRWLFAPESLDGGDHPRHPEAH